MAGGLHWERVIHVSTVQGFWGEGAWQGNVLYVFGIVGFLVFGDGFLNLAAGGGKNKKPSVFSFFPYHCGPTKPAKNSPCCGVTFVISMPGLEGVCPSSAGWVLVKSSKAWGDSTSVYPTCFYFAGCKHRKGNGNQSSNHCCSTASC